MWYTWTDNIYIIITPLLETACWQYDVSVECAYISVGTKTFIILDYENLSS